MNFQLLPREANKCLEFFNKVLSDPSAQRGSTKSLYQGMLKIIKLGHCKNCVDLKGNIEYSKFVARCTTSSLACFDKRLSELRRAWKIHEPSKIPLINSILLLTAKERVFVMSRQNLKRTKALSNKIFIKPGVFAETMDKLLDSENIGDIIICLMMACGRRLIEILAVCDMPGLIDNSSREIENGQDGRGRLHSKYGPGVVCVQFTHQAKIKAGQESKPFTVPLLDMSYEEFSDYWQAMRKHIVANNENHLAKYESDPFKFREGIAAKYGSLVSKRMKKLNLPIHRSHQLRKWYAAVCCHRHKPRYVDDTVFITSVLGHNSSTACLNYKNISVAL